MIISNEDIGHFFHYVSILYNSRVYRFRTPYLGRRRKGTSRNKLRWPPPSSKSIIKLPWTQPGTSTHICLHNRSVLWPEYALLAHHLPQFVRHSVTIDPPIRQAHVRLSKGMSRRRRGYGTTAKCTRKKKQQETVFLPARM